MKQNFSKIKFEAAEELGECMNVIYPKYFPYEERFEFRVLSHKEFDGIGGMTKIMEDEGYTVDQQPQLKIKKKPRLTKRIKELFRFIGLTRPTKQKWVQKKNRRGKGMGFAFSWLPKEVTESLQGYCKSNGVSVTSFLLSTLDEVSKQQFLEEKSHGKWLAPINMRGAVSPEKVYGNTSASIVIETKAHSCEKNIHQQLKTYLKKGTHWGAWIYTNLGRVLGKSGTKFLAKRMTNLGTGVFSNLGSWPLEVEKTKDHVWSLVVPASQILPIAAGLLTWQNQLTLTIQLHPSISGDLDQSSKLMREWIYVSMKRAKLLGAPYKVHTVNRKEWENAA